MKFRRYDGAKQLLQAYDNLPDNHGLKRAGGTYLHLLAEFCNNIPLSSAQYLIKKGQREGILDKPLDTGTGVYTALTALRSARVHSAKTDAVVKAFVDAGAQQSPYRRKVCKP